jgi:hypothetical protein
MDEKPVVIPQQGQLTNQAWGECRPETHDFRFILDGEPQPWNAPVTIHASETLTGRLSFEFRLKAPS